MHTACDPPIDEAAPDGSPPRYVVAVRALCEFTAKRGDLDLRFTPTPTAQEGMAGHSTVTARRAAGYVTEVALAGDYGPLRVRGRADGYDPAANQLEEIKTHRGRLDAMPANHRELHWAQARIYGWLLCRKLGLAQVRVALVYFDIASQKETVFVETHSADTLREHFVVQCERFIAWAAQELEHRSARDAALSRLAFPHASFRPGQRDLAAAVYRSAVARRCLMAQAPTGIGKTLGTLFPLLKAWPGQQFDKIFFLTAKSAGRTLALDALTTLTTPATPAAPQPPLRVLELVARDKACEHPGLACHGESCPLARGFYDRLSAARAAALATVRLDREALRRVALAHEVCPYYLSQELSRWSDVIVGDYNYYFDSSAMLFALAEANRWRVGVLVDEAHNLVDRARSMYSATLDQAAFNAMRCMAPAFLKKSLARVGRCWRDLSRDQTAGYAVQPALPERLIAALEQANSQMTDYVAEHPDALSPDTLRFYFDAMHFVRIAERFDTHSIFDITLAGTPGAPGARQRSAALCLRNVIPAPHLKPRFARAHSIALFSATLTPAHFYSDTLGLPESSVCVDVASPFTAQQLEVRAIADVSTRYRDREQSIGRVVDLIAAQYARAPGNYLSFFSSFEYLAQVAAALAARHPSIPVWEQSRAMSEPDQQAFLDRFVPNGCGIGFAVLGGSFGEAIDLPGTRLVGAFVATLGLPQLNPVNQQMRARMQEAFGAGYDYAYLFPGLQKVVQAAGRVIRGPLDRGVLYLIDDRFARPDVRRLLPAWWRVDVVRQREG
ncbi:DinG family ATP-dependent helicase CPE1197 [Caballeronia glathei]|uniref:ATP-dependent DNA helicase n=1 Tax=Caballeronia glathei TaxID=60547 RepID=A0A069PTN8_9BURK|nr:ATP-dependent DNA helicase [Caballeronia glathei]KDR43179.1 ATP-dependent DNA helicase [Caballeronia glathei]CDY79264.1 DinG family ATP-dependent helicase CPE1197 [Caballeronia glathei]